MCISLKFCRYFSTSVGNGLDRSGAFGRISLVAFLMALRAAALFEYLRRCTRSCLLEIEQQKNALHFRVRHSLVHHQWARQEFSPVCLSACKASILLRKTARAVVRRARRTLFAPRFRSRSIVAPAHKPATIFSDQSPRDEHERLREVRVRPEGNGATKKPQHSLRLFLVHHRGLSRGLRNAALWRSLRHCVPPPCSSIPDGAPDRAFLK